MKELTLNTLAIIVSILLIPAAIVCAIFAGIIEFIYEVLKFLKDYFEIIRSLLGGDENGKEEN